LTDPVGGDHNDLRRQGTPFDFAQDIETVGIRKVNVNDKHVGDALLNAAQRFGAARDRRSFDGLPR
jgi:hypothetical protein